MKRIRTKSEGGLVMAAVLGAVGAAASFVAVNFVKRMLEEKPLDQRIEEGKQKAADITSSVVKTVNDTVGKFKKD